MDLLDLSCGGRCCLCGQPCAVTRASHLRLTRTGQPEEGDHFCGEIHPCPHDCEMDGCCHIERMEDDKGERTVRRKCCRVILPFRREHDGLHAHTLTDALQTHYCGTPCPVCRHLCHLPPGHSGPHSTEHGAMREEAAQLIHRHEEGADPAAMTCGGYCSAMGSGHTHLVPCPWHKEHSSLTRPPSLPTLPSSPSSAACPFHDELSLLTSGRVHRGHIPPLQMDELTHDAYWRYMGFEDPLRASAEPNGREQDTNATAAEFDSCTAQCKAAQHKLQQQHTQDHYGAHSGCCSRHVSHERLDPHKAGYLDEIAMQACRFSAGALSPRGHHLPCDHAFHHYILLDSSKNMLQDDIAPSKAMRVFHERHHTALHVAKSYQNRLGAAIELVYRYVQIRHKLSPNDRVTILHFHSKSISVDMDSKPVLHYGSVPDILLSSVKPEKKSRYSAALQRVTHLVEQHRSENIKHKRQPLCMLVTGGQADTSKRRRSSSGKSLKERQSSGFFKTINFGGSLSKDSGADSHSSVHAVAELLREMNGKSIAVHSSQIPKLNIVKLGEEGDDSTLNDLALYGVTHGKSAIRIVDRKMNQDTGHELDILQQEKSKASVDPHIRNLLAKLLLQYEDAFIDDNYNQGHKHGSILFNIALPGDAVRASVGSAASAPTLSKRDQRRLVERDNFAKEILETERSYVWSISKCLEIFYYPLANEWSHIISDSARRELFSGLVSIYELHKKLLDALEKRLSEWHSSQKMGDIFIGMAPLFKMYTQYTTKYLTAMNTLKRLSTQLPLKDFMHVRKLDPYVQGHNLTSLLIMPIQRVPRYELLLKGMLKETPKSHPDRQDIAKAQTQMKETADYLNTKISEREQQFRMRMIEERVSGIRGLIKPNRWFVKDGRLLYNLPLMGTEPCVVFLFNDVLLHACELQWSTMTNSNHGSGSDMNNSLRKRRTRSMSHIPTNDAVADDPLLALSPGYAASRRHIEGKLFEAKFIFQLHELSVEDVHRKNDCTAFEIVRSRGPLGEGRRFMYYCSTEEEKREWMDTLERCIEVARERKSYFTRQQYLVRIKQDVALIRTMKSSRY